MKKIKTFEDACKALNIEPSALPDVSTLPESHRAALIAHYKLVIIAQALNEGWIPDWNNSDEYKYYPYFNMRSIGFSHVYFDFWYSYSSVGSRLCFKSEALAKYAGTQFADLYKEYFLL